MIFIRSKRGKITLFGNGTRGTGHRMEEAELFDVLSLGANDMVRGVRLQKHNVGDFLVMRHFAANVLSNLQAS